MKLLIYKDAYSGVLLDVDGALVWEGSLADWSFALANPWVAPLGPPAPSAVADTPCDVEDSA